MHISRHVVAAVAALLGPSLVSAKCKSFTNGATCAQPFFNSCGGEGTSTLNCCTTLDCK
ncbi:hypothetical protein CCHR01_17417 [Colletotrichum chrysophilum]|uniref:Uncharacterized protein n=1 Tax=Colletotrichum chrysophilum TaxID=1836956 RepID=A0AAD9A6M0_9PEZI|nr:hypothetical protein CCHR01_17417 [Colletotrichum chrysophilum]